MQFTERHIPSFISPERLDDYLAKGWYRSGQSVFTCRFLLKRGDLYTVVWTRQPLEGYKFRKGQRKLIRKTEEQFKIVIRPEPKEISPEKENLYQLYREDFKGRLAPSLQVSLRDNTSNNIFDTWEICIYDNDKLVAFSIFDLGSNSIQSINAIYHPDYKKHSLGYYTMLAEINFAQQKGFEHYYAGYVVPGYSAFDYKLRAGDNMEFYIPETDDWRPMSEFDDYPLMHKVMIERLEELQVELGKRGIPTRMGVYPLYETVFWNLANKYHFGYPLILQVYPDFHLYSYLNFVYDPSAEQYRFIPCESLNDITEHFEHQINPEAQMPLVTELLGMYDNLLAGNNPKEAIYRMKMWISRQMF